MADAGKYPIEVFYSEEDEGYIAVARDLPGCSAFGSTHAEAATELQQAIDAWKMAASNAGNPIPEPTAVAQAPLPSGKLLLRIPRSLHATLLDLAKKEDVSLNQYLVSTLSASTASHLFISADHISRAFENIEVNRFVSRHRAWDPMRRHKVFYRYDSGGYDEDGIESSRFHKVVVKPSVELNFQPEENYDVRTLKAGVPVIVKEGR